MKEFFHSVFLSVSITILIFTWFLGFIFCSFKAEANNKNLNEFKSLQKIANDLNKPSRGLASIKIYKSAHKEIEKAIDLSIKDCFKYRKKINDEVKKQGLIYEPENSFKCDNRQAWKIWILTGRILN